MALADAINFRILIGDANTQFQDICGVVESLPSDEWGQFLGKAMVQQAAEAVLSDELEDCVKASFVYCHLQAFRSQLEIGSEECIEPAAQDA